MMKENLNKIAFVDWLNTKHNSLQPFHVINLQIMSFTLCENFALAINRMYQLFLSKKYYFRQKGTFYLGKLIRAHFKSNKRFSKKPT